MARNRLQFDINAKDKTKRAFSSLKNGLKGVSKAIFNMKTGLAAVAGVAGLGLLIRNSLKSIDKLGKLSRQVFISTEDLSAFRLAADLGGTSLEAFAKGARTMAIGINDWLVKGTGIAKEAFEQLGITQDDLRATNNDLFAQFELVANALRNVEGGTNKTAIAYKLFGGRNIELLTAIERGTDGMQEMAEEAKRFGLVLTTDMVKAVEDANDSLTRTKSLFTGVANNMTVALAPAIETVSTNLREMLLKHVEDAHDGMTEFGTWLGNKFIEIIGKVLEAFIKAKYVLLDFGKNIENIGAKWHNFGTKMMIAIGPSGWPLAMERGLKEVKETVKTDSAEMIAELEALQNFINNITTRNDDNAKKVLEGDDDGKKKTAEDEIKLLFDVEKVKDMILKKKEADAQRAIDIENDRVKRTLDAERSYAVMSKQIKEQAKADIKSNMEGTLTIMSGSSQKAFKMLKAHKIAEAIVNTYSAVMKAFSTVPYPLNYAVAGSALAFGMAQVSQIRAQKFTPRRQGGIVSENKPYMVGEGGPETFVPNSAGTIVPSGMGGQNVNVNFTINAVDTAGFQALLSNERGMIVSMINSAVNQQGKSNLI